MWFPHGLGLQDLSQEGVEFRAPVPRGCLLRKKYSRRKSTQTPGPSEGPKGSNARKNLLYNRSTLHTRVRCYNCCFYCFTQVSFSKSYVLPFKNLLPGKTFSFPLKRLCWPQGGPLLASAHRDFSSVNPVSPLSCACPLCPSPHPSTALSTRPGQGQPFNSCASSLLLARSFLKEQTSSEHLGHS